LAVRRLRFRVSGWLDDEDFRRLMEFSRYLGREGGGLLLEIDPLKAERNGYKLEDIIAVLKDLEEKVDKDVIEALENELREERKVRVWLEGESLYVSSRTYLKSLFEEMGYIPYYDRERRAFRLPPHKYGEVVEAFRRKGLYVEDEVSLLEKRLQRRVSFRGELRDYQQEALEAWRSSGHRGVIALPTGAGKTVIAIAAIAELSVPTLVVAYTKEQVLQWVRFLREFSDAGGMVSAYYSEEKRLSPITVTTYQTAFRKIDLFLERFSFLIVDEVHHLPADKFKRIAMTMPAPFRLGLSATVEREDGRHEELFPLMGGIVYRTDPGELAEKGYLAPYVIRTIKVDLPPDKKKEYLDLRAKFSRLSGGRTFNELLEAVKKGDPSAIEAVRLHAKMRSIIQENSEKIRVAKKIIEEELRKGSKIIVFTQFKGQAEEIARAVGGLLLHGDLPSNRRKAVLEAFRRMDSGVLVVTTVGDEGLDIPDANVGIFLSGTGSRRQFIQRLGRLLRPRPGKRAVLYEIVTARSSEEYQARKRKRWELF